MNQDFQITNPRPNFYQIEQFSFRVRFGKINWQDIGSLDFSELVQAHNLEYLRHILENLTFSSLDRDDLQRIGDPNVIKIIKLQQLAVEYLMTVQHGLSVQLENFRQNYHVQCENSKQLNSELIQNETRIEKLKQTYYEKKRAVSSYQMLLRHPATATVLNKVMDRSNAVRCPHCPKAYISENFLQKHIWNRHSRPSTVQPQMPQTPDVNIVMSTMKDLMLQQLNMTQQLHSREINTIKDQFEKQIQDLSTQQRFYTERLKTADLNQSFNQSQSHQAAAMLQQTQREKEELRRMLENHKKKLEEYENKLQNVKQNNIELNQQKNQIKQSLENARKQVKQVQIEIQQEPQINIQQSVVHQEIVSVKEKEVIPQEFQIKRSIPLPHSNAGIIEDDPEALPPPQPTLSKSNAGDIEQDEEWLEDLPIIPMKQKKTLEQAMSELGMDPVEDQKFEYIAQLYINKPLPNGWNKVVESGLKKYIELKTQRTTMQHPGREFYRQMFLNAKRQRQLKADEEKFRAALAELGMSETNDRPYFYIVYMYIEVPLPDMWLEKQGSFHNQETGEILQNNPGKDYYMNMYIQAKLKNDKILNQVETTLNKNTDNCIFEYKYQDGIKTVYKHDQVKAEDYRIQIQKSIEAEPLYDNSPQNPTQQYNITFELVRKELERLYLCRVGVNKAEIQVKSNVEEKQIELFGSPRSIEDKAISIKKDQGGFLQGDDVGIIKINKIESKQERGEILNISKVITQNHQQRPILKRDSRDYEVEIKVKSSEIRG